MPESSRYAARRAAGDCTTCGADKATPGRTRCVSCRKRATAAERVRRQGHIAKGKCRSCGGRAPEKGRRDCRPCLDRFAAYMRSRTSGARS